LGYISALSLRTHPGVTGRSFPASDTGSSQVFVGIYIAVVDVLAQVGCEVDFLAVVKVVCEFYNVLWIERVEGIAYRRALG
jgi:hypothetical protein